MSDLSRLHRDSRHVVGNSREHKKSESVITSSVYGGGPGIFGSSPSSYGTLRSRLTNETTTGGVVGGGGGGSYKHRDQVTSDSEGLSLVEEGTRRQPFATSCDFENMVGDLRRSFIGWLKKTEGELRRERDAVVSERKSFEEEKKKAWKMFLSEKQVEYEKIQVSSRPSFGLVNNGRKYLKMYSMAAYRQKVTIMDGLMDG